MQSVLIENIVNFTTKLFKGQIFDDFLFLEGNVMSNCSYTLNGRLNKSIYSTEELSSVSEPFLASWHDIKPIFSSMVNTVFSDTHNIKYHLTLCLSPEQTRKLLVNSQSLITFNDIESLHINIRYENGKIICTTGTSLKIFTLDKSLEQYFDRYTINFLDRVFGNTLL